MATHIEPESTLVRCPACQVRIAVPLRALGRDVRCPKCHNAFHLDAPVQHRSRMLLLTGIAAGVVCVVVAAGALIAMSRRTPMHKEQGAAIASVNAPDVVIERDSDTATLSTGSGSPAQDNSAVITNDAAEVMAALMIQAAASSSGPQGTAAVEQALSPAQRPKLQMPEMIDLRPPPDETALLVLGLVLAEKPISLQELYDAAGVAVASTLSPETPSASQPFRITLRLSRTANTPQEDLQLVIPVGTHFKPNRVQAEPRYQSLTAAQQALVDDVAKRSKQTGAAAGEFSDRRGPRREIAAHARRIEVQLGDEWRVWYLVGPQDGKYLASLRPFDYSAARFRRDQVRLKPDFKRERDDLLARAAAGDVDAQARLGREYLSEDSLRVPHEPAEALRWNLAAAGQQHVGAMMRLVAQYRDGIGVGRDPAAALQWLQRAAETGYVSAQVQLAEWYAGSRLAQQNIPEARRWIETALQSGSPEAQFHYGLMLLRGVAYPANTQESQKWIAIAAHRGHEPAARYMAEQAMLQVALVMAVDFLTSPDIPESHRSKEDYDREYDEYMRNSQRMEEMWDRALEK